MRKGTRVLKAKNKRLKSEKHNILKKSKRILKMKELLQI